MFIKKIYAIQLGLKNSSRQRVITYKITRVSLMDKNFQRMPQLCGFFF